jgi:serine/threonine-protein kinase
MGARIVGGRYELLERLGEGGMGTVFRGRHLVSERQVAVKLVHPHLVADPETAERFKREASAAAKVRHPGLVDILDAGVDADSGTLFLVMELLEGESMRTRMRAPEAPGAGIVQIVRALCDPLGALHRAGLVHRDVKPENVLLAREQDGLPLPDGLYRCRVKLLDLGLVRLSGGTGATGAGVGLGTPLYMAPEQFMSAREATAAADVWSVGVILYEAVTGRPPFTGATPHAVLVAVSSSAPVPIRTLAPFTAPELAAVIERCLAKDPAARPRDANELGVELDRALRTSTGRASPFSPAVAPGQTIDAFDATAPSVRPPPAPPSPRRRMAVIAAAVALIGAAIPGAFLLTAADGEGPPRPGATPPPSPPPPPAAPEPAERNEWRGQPGAAELYEELVSETPPERVSRAEEAIASGSLEVAKSLLDSVVADPLADAETVLRAQMALVELDVEEAARFAASQGQPETDDGLAAALVAVSERFEALIQRYQSLGALISDDSDRRFHESGPTTGAAPTLLRSNARCATYALGRLHERRVECLLALFDWRAPPSALPRGRSVTHTLAVTALQSALQAYVRCVRLPLIGSCGADAEERRSAMARRLQAGLPR